VLQRAWLLAIVTFIGGWVALAAAPGDRVAQLLVYVGSVALVCVAVAGIAIAADRLLGLRRDSRARS
jgi:hypothetical protein